MSCTATCLALKIQSFCNQFGCLKIFTSKLECFKAHPRFLRTRLWGWHATHFQTKSCVEGSGSWILSIAGPRKWWCGASNHQRQARFQTWRRLGSCEGCFMLICQTVGVQCIDERTMPDNMEDLLVVRPQVLRSVKKQRAEAPTRSIWHRPVVLSSRLRRIGTPASHREWWSARLRRVEFCQEQGSRFKHMSIWQIHKMILMTLAASRSLRCIPPASNRPLYFRIVKQKIFVQRKRIYVGSNVFDFHTFTIIHRMFETPPTRKEAKH